MFICIALDMVVLYIRPMFDTITTHIYSGHTRGFQSAMVYLCSTGYGGPLFNTSTTFIEDTHAIETCHHLSMLLASARTVHIAR